MSWWSILPTLLVALAIFIVPGAIVGFFARARGFALIAVSPVISISLISIAAVVAPWAGVEWSVIDVVVVTIIGAGVVHVVTRLLSPREPIRLSAGRKWWQLLAEAGAVALAAVLIGRRLVSVFGRPDAISQTFDNVFHLNAVRYILDTGNASSLTVGAMTGGAFYPAAWHDTVSLLVQVTGAQIPTAVIAVNMCIGAIVWPLGCILLVHRALGRRVLPTLIAGVLAAGFGAFPILMMDYGVLYPYALGISLLPATIATAVGALGAGVKAGPPRATSWLLLAMSLPGLTLAHPSILMTLLALLVPAIFGLSRRTVLKAQDRGVPTIRVAAVTVLGVGAAAAAALVLWRVVRPAAEASGWPPVETTGRAVGELLLGSQIGQPISLVMSVLAMTGLIVSIARRQRLWLVGMYAVLGLLFVVAASFPIGGVRSFFTGVWYNDSPRLAALLPTATLPLAVVGSMFFVSAARKKLKTVAPKLLDVGNPNLKVWISGASVGVIIVFLALGTQQANVKTAARNAAGGYALSSDSSLMTLDEMRLIQRLDNQVPAGVTIAANPWNGSSLAFALADRKTLQLHLISEISPDAMKINQHLRDAKSDPEVCSSVRALGVGYVLDFGHREVHGADHGYYGLDGLESAGVGRLIDSEGEAKLYKIEACN